MSYKYKILFLVAPAVLLLDQWTKSLILGHLVLGQTIPVIPDFFDLVHVRNSGAAFGLLASWGDGLRVPFFYGISFLAVCFLGYFFTTLPKEDRFHPWPLSLITAGVFGNLIDRIRFGNVVDFLSFHIGDQSLWGIPLIWPAFNVADSAITISMILLAFSFLQKK
ncbi:MAG: signal peptidase II [Deltaproteobacteria bacterium]|nr:signal peptidase II [Deltaproteobacteria bacterium]